MMFIPTIDKVILNKSGDDRKYSIYKLSNYVHNYRINNLEDNFEIGDIHYLEIYFMAQEWSNNTSNNSAGDCCDNKFHSPSHLLPFFY